MTKIGLVGAFDRNNYGDVLMPIIFEEYMKKREPDFKFDYFGLADSNMQKIKGVNTKALYRINEENMKFDFIVIVGGEVLTSQYSNMYLNLQNNNKTIFFGNLFKIFSKKLFNQYAKKKLHGQEIYPWIIGDNTVGNAKIIYNTVGGKNCKSIQPNIDNFNRASYISVRELETYKKLESMNLTTELQLYPDSVVSVSDIITEKKLNENVTDNLVKEVSNFGKYFVFQCKNAIGKKYVNQIVKEIEKIFMQYNIGCVFLPIGYAQGHEDNIILKKIYDKVKTKKLLIDQNTIYDTIYVIKNADLFCGTSLHGIITSISYQIPHFALTNNIEKQIDFIKTWKTSEICYTEIKDLSENFGKLYESETNKQIMKEARKNLINLANENFEKIYSILKENEKHE